MHEYKYVYEQPHACPIGMMEKIQDHEEFLSVSSRGQSKIYTIDGVQISSS